MKNKQVTLISCLLYVAHLATSAVFLAAFGAVLSCAISGCAYQDPNAPLEGETEGKPNQGPPEVENPPEWYCRDRLPPGEFVVTVAALPGDDDGGETGGGGIADWSTKDLERCPYAPSTHPSDPWPGKPYWIGIPEPVLAWLESIGDVLDDDEVHPVWARWNVNTDEWEPHLANEEDFRSGLTCNFALWPTGGVPTSGARPPIVTASFADVTGDLPTMFGHPFLAGRENGCGMPCSTKNSSNSSFDLWPPDSVAFKNNENVDCMAAVVFEGVEPAHTLYPHAPNDPDDRALDVAQCLDNGSQYDPAKAALTSLERNGLVWLNWDELALIVTYVNTQLNQVPGWSDLMVLIDYLADLGFEWNYWPSDPPYPYSRWSSTGVCGFPATLSARLVNGQVRIETWVGCPASMLPVFSDFNTPDDEDIEAHGWRHEGYCTYAHAVAPPPGVGLTVMPEISVGKPGSGFVGARYLDVTQLDEDTLRAWSNAVNLIETPLGAYVMPVSPLGRDLLEAFGIPEDAAIIAVNDVLLVDGEDGTPGATTWDAALEIDRSMSAGEIVVVLLDTIDGERLHRYLVPHVPAPSE